MKRINMLRQYLRNPFAPQVVDRSILSKGLKEEIHPHTLTRLVKQMEEAGDLIRVRRGLFLNGFAHPHPNLASVAQYVRSGAIVSLHRVLGDAGVHNNPSRVVTCVVPHDRRNGGGGTDIDLPGGAFRMHAIAPRVLHAGESRDRLDKHNYPRATPEAALIHWLYLGNHPRGSLEPPRPHDIDVDLLDRDRLDRIAAAAGMTATVETFLERALEAEEEDEPIRTPGGP